MINHFGVNVKEDSYLSRDTYAKINQKSSFKFKINSVTYDDNDKMIYSMEWCELHRNNCLKNFDINMKRFELLSSEKFNQEINDFIKRNPVFKKVDKISDYRGVNGYYIMVLDKYKQLYIGTSSDIEKRIKQHWLKNKQFDRLLLPIGNVEGSVMSIDSFKALDTTRIYAFDTYDTYIREDDYINEFSPEFVTNRIPGGNVSGLDALIGLKTR